ncbi:single-stranded-DNA-specific exonuclease RecJ [Flavobacterium cyanobacteriorum]|uniref:Single-stranded-DNA-specific exonuclease RecJ n=1 Tax=Flavobacterium cyanobacteriorum TaxID=2022802 RepID=A0A255YZ59_9FLAO|nr:single-stranded-DNA-specific exonuclease RecJ [Flavobacterium cyanobacteriorum]OYQ33954.1 single-stranded-DNA-specific exonuclease RecJ [Flavobacterium cyanobacteriorum]
MRWTLKPQPAHNKVKQLAEALSINEVIASLLVQRGVESFEQAKQFFRPSLSDLHDPFLMKDMDRAVRRIEQAIANNENILVFGDYDVDGTASVALVSSYLRSYYENVDTYIPDRYTEGYGVSFAGIDYAYDNGCSLIIALDCGIKSIDKVEYATAKGIDFIICDHHRPGDTLPLAVAVLDPKREDCTYPYDELCGCGIGFKLVQALAGRRGLAINDLIPYLDLVATAIAADIVPITGENRVLAKFGLEVINANPRPGIRALIRNIKKQELCINDVVFIIAPRINAAGRIRHGKYAVELLTEFNLEQAEECASQIELLNADRKGLDKQMTIEALRQIEERAETNCFTTVVYNENWHKGVLGIVASRLTETYYRPTLVFTKSGDRLAASARSVKDFDIYNALEACAEHLEQFGGHMYAAGLTLKEEQFPDFKARFEAVVAETIDPALLTPEISIDAEITFSQITPRFYRILKQFEPFGPGNMTPVFLSRNLKDTGFGKPIGADESHLRLFIKQQGTEGFPAIGFGLAAKKELACNGNAFDAVYSVDENVWNGQASLQLRLRDIRCED